jgi:hypothetical protein
MVCSTDPSPNPAACYSDSARQKTCDPCYRSLTSDADTIIPTASGGTTTCGAEGNGGCKDVMLQFCSGSDLSNDDPESIQILSDRWFTFVSGVYQPGPCTFALERNLFENIPTPCVAKGAIPFTTSCRSLIPSSGTTATSGEPGTAGVNMSALSSAGVAWGQELFAAVFAKYKALGFTIGSVPGTIGYNPFQDYLYNICCQVPIICSGSLDSICSIYSAQRLSFDPDVANWCGCYLPDQEYASYVDAYQINKECTPMCNRLTTIPIVNGANSAILCTQDICIIDDISINLNNTSSNGGINISQLCGNCSGTFGSRSTCSCIIQNNTIEGANAVIGNINLNEACSSTTCNVTNPGFPGLPPTIEVPCDQISDPNSVYSQELAQLQAAEAAQRRRTLAVYLIIFGVFLVVVIIAYFLIRPRFGPIPDRYVYPESSTTPPERAEVGQT